MGGGTSGVSPPSQTTNFRPWKAQAPYLKDIMSQAQAQSQVPQQFYPGQMTAPQDEATISAMNAAEARAKAGSPLLTGAQNYTSDVLSGKYLNNNTYLDATYNQAARGVTQNFNEAVLPALESRFAAAGRMGSGAYGAGLDRSARDLGVSLQDLATNIYGQNYARERGVQDSAAGAAPALAAADYGDINQLAGVGASREAHAQSLIDELVQRFNFGQQEPGQRLARYAGVIGAPIGGPATAYGNTKRGGDWGSIIGGILGV